MNQISTRKKACCRMSNKHRTTSSARSNTNIITDRNCACQIFPCKIVFPKQNTIVNTCRRTNQHQSSSVVSISISQTINAIWGKFKSPSIVKHCVIIPNPRSIYIIKRTQCSRAKKLRYWGKFKSPSIVKHSVIIPNSRSIYIIKRSQCSRTKKLRYRLL